MKIAQLTYSYKPILGGADAYAELLCNILRARGHEVWVYQRAAQVDDPLVRTAPSWQARFRPRDFWIAPYWLKGRRPELEGMDVLIAHYPNYCAAVAWHPRLVGLSHGVTWDDAPHSWRGRRKRRMAEWAFERCTRFVANDTFFLREMGLSIAPGERPFEEIVPGRWFIPNCVNIDVFKPSPNITRLPHIIVPRNLYRNRGVHLAVEAFAAIANEFPGYKMRIVGTVGQSRYTAEVNNLIHRLGLAQRIHLEGGKSWLHMPAEYARARVCLIPSLCGEGTSFAALEAMACATATVTTNVGGLPDLPSVHCPPCTEALAATLRDILVRWRVVGEQQREAVTRNFSLERWRQAWTQVVEDW
ncbi:MAG: glycosyltransferase family 4 protein [Candidatus Zipacnadales bacterium]